VRDAQKSRAADKRLEDAALVKRRAEQEAAEIRANAQAEAETTKAAAVKPNSGDALPTDAITKAVAHLYDGEQEQAGSDLTAAIAGAVNAEVGRRVAELKGAGATVDTQAVASQVRHELAWDQALEQFVADQPVIAKDPHLLGMWQNTLNEVAKESRTPAEAVKKATERTQDWLKRVAGKPEKAATDDSALANRQARKDAAGRLHVAPSTSTRAPSAARQDQGPAKPTDVIAEMKKARGQA
jgi:hypothetical protein